MTQPPVDIAVIGAAGLIGRRHVAHVLSEPAAALACIVDPTPAGAALAAEHSVPHYPSVAALLAARDAGSITVSAAIVATPNTSHAPLGIPLLTAGITTLIEKPLSVSSAACTTLLAAAAASRTPLLTGHHRRFNPYLTAARHSILTGTLGRILAISGLWTTLKPLRYFTASGAWRKLPGSGGPVLINLIHEIDCLRYLLGDDIVRVHVERGAPNTRAEHAVEETVALTLRFRGGAVGAFVLSDAAASPYNWEHATGENPGMPRTGQNVYTLVGTRGSMCVPELKRWHYDGGDGEGGEGSWTTPIQSDLDARAGMDLDTPPFTLQLRNLVAVARGMEAPRCSGEEGARAVGVVEAVMRSLESGGAVDVEVPGLAGGAGVGAGEGEGEGEGL
ncbi:hypothetical protein EDC01DRAFT_762596 [Geopyxis carbonaria]|nr:hypothetical protein EDC01DRAFT_762596 [Geopyxis carbonaria]